MLWDFDGVPRINPISRAEEVWADLLDSPNLKYDRALALNKVLHRSHLNQRVQARGFVGKGVLGETLDHGSSRNHHQPPIPVE
jgi:hypothetical protein